MNLGNNGSSDFLLQAGGGLQTSGTPQSSGSVSQPNQSSLFPGGQTTEQTNNAARQDIFGGGTTVATNVEYTPGTQKATSDPVEQSASPVWHDPIILGTLIAIVVVFGVLAYKIIRE